MKIGRLCSCFAAFVLAVSASAVLGATMSVQVRNGQLRATPSFLGKVTAVLEYGDRVAILEQQGDWMRVDHSGAAGWIHHSALTKKKVAMQGGSGQVKTGASSEELALSSKGFNSDVEAEFKEGNSEVDYAWVDKMERQFVTTPEDLRNFLIKGEVVPKGANP